MQPDSSTEEPGSVQPLGTAGAADEVRFAGMGELRDAWGDASESIEFLLRQTSAFVARQATQRPQVLLASAVGLGFVLGGGLASGTGTMLVKACGRLALEHLVQRVSGPSV